MDKDLIDVTTLQYFVTRISDKWYLYRFNPNYDTGKHYHEVGIFDNEAEAQAMCNILKWSNSNASN